MEIRKRLVLFVLMFLADLYGFSSAVEFEPCLHAVNNEPCNMTCRVQDFTNTVEIKFNGSSRGRCTLFGCDSSFLKEGGNTVIYKIPSLSYANDDGKWECTYGGNPSSPSNVTIYSGISNTPNLTFSLNDADGVKLTAIVECLYPYNPKVDVQYSETGDDEQFVSLSQQVKFQSSTTPGGCSDAIERRLTATYDVSAKHAKLEGKSVFFRMAFSQYELGQVNYTNIEGPFYFKDCSLDIFLYGFLPVFLIVLIVSIAIIIILKIERLPQQFGELAWKKLVIIAICFVVAIIIGVCLGLLIKGCDKKYLALGLSLLFGILIVVTLIFALIYYHKKCESRRGVPERVLEYIPCSQSGQ